MPYQSIKLILYFCSQFVFILHSFSTKSSGRLYVASVFYGEIPGLFEGVFADDAMKRDDIKAGTDCAANAVAGVDEEVDFAAEVEGAGSFDRKDLDFAMRDRGMVDLFAGQALDIRGDDAFVDKGALIADSFEDGHDGFTSDQKLMNDRNYLFGGDCECV